MPTRKTPARNTSGTRPAAEGQDWMSRIRESSHDVYLAGLASLARARQPGAVPAFSDFEQLVDEGRKLEPQMKASMSRAWTELKEKSRAPVALRSEGRLQEVFEERVASVLARLGVPSRKEMQELQDKLDRVLAAQGRPAAKASKAAKPAKAAAPGAKTTRPRTARRAGKL